MNEIVHVVQILNSMDEFIMKLYSREYVYIESSYLKELALDISSRYTVVQFDNKFTERYFHRILCFECLNGNYVSLCCIVR